ncbi:MAG: hypothetical protein HQK83_10385 [Fibrobacteria bacterium]|nr:hypothetical protein [Fibrobacteria bacterium]
MAICPNCEMEKDTLCLSSYYNGQWHSMSENEGHRILRLLDVINMRENEDITHGDSQLNLF